MVDPVTAVGLAGNIVQFVEFAAIVLSRIDEFNSRVKDVPEAFRSAKANLPLLTSNLQAARDRLSGPGMSPAGRRAVEDATNSCQELLRELDDILSKVLPTEKDSFLKKGKKAISSVVKYDQRVAKISAELQLHATSLTQHFVTISFRAAQAKPKSLLPSDRLTAFVGREIVLEATVDAFESTNRLAIFGKGGVGKTRTALEYCQRVLEYDQNIWSFWVSGTTTARFRQSLTDIARQINIPGSDKPKTNVLQALADWLRDPNNGRWQLVLDNLDDASSLLDHQRLDTDPADAPQPSRSNTKPLIEYIPRVSHGNVLITSRNKAAAMALTDDPSQIIELPPMRLEEATLFWSHQLPADTSPLADVEELSGMLDQLPLPMKQAAAYIRQVPGMTLTKYLQLLKSGESSYSRVLLKQFADSTRDADGVNSILLTWTCSFEYIRREQPGAIDLLGLMSCYDSKDIPSSLLPQSFADNEDLDFTISSLANFSLVDYNEKRQTWSMHRLVQVASQVWLQANQQLDSVKLRALQLATQSFPDGYFRNWETCSALYPHAGAVVKFIPAAVPDRLLRADLLVRLGVFDRSRAFFLESLRFLDEALKVREEILGFMHKDTIKAAGECGYSLRSLHRFKEAEMLHRRALEEAKKNPAVTDEMHFIVNNLAASLRGQGRLSEAADLYRETYDLETKNLGPNDLQTLRTANNYARLLRQLHRYEEAERMQRHAWQGLKALFGDEHKEVFTNMKSVAWCLLDLGRPVEAEPLFLAAMQKEGKYMGSTHPNTMFTVDGYARCLEVNEKYGEAITQTERLIKHPKTAGENDQPTLEQYKARLERLKIRHREQQAVEEAARAAATRRQAQDPKGKDEESFTARPPVRVLSYRAITQRSPVTKLLGVVLLCVVLHFALRSYGL